VEQFFLSRRAQPNDWKHKKANFTSYRVLLSWDQILPSLPENGLFVELNCTELALMQIVMLRNTKKYFVADGRWLYNWQQSRSLMGKFLLFIQLCLVEKLFKKTCVSCFTRVSKHSETVFLCMETLIRNSHLFLKYNFYGCHFDQPIRLNNKSNFCALLIRISLRSASLTSYLFQLWKKSRFYLLVAEIIFCQHVHVVEIVFLLFLNSCPSYDSPNFSLC